MKSKMSLLGHLVDQDKKVVTVNINVGYSVVIPVTINYDTGLLFTLAEQMSEEQSLDMNIVLPGFDEFSTTLYVTFISGHDMTNMFVIDRQTMIHCLSIYDLMGDINFFKWLLTSLFKLWTVLSPVMYGSRVSEEVKWDIWLHSPHQLLPEIWQLDPTFMKTWLQRDDNKNVVVNSDELFIYETVTVGTNENFATDNIDDDHSIITTTKSTSYTRRYDDINICNNKIEERTRKEILSVEYNTTYNGYDHGKVIIEYCGDGGGDNENNNNVPETEIYYAIDGIEFGSFKFYEKDSLVLQYYNINGKHEGITTHYYSGSGRIKCETPYLRGLCHGEEVNYYDTDANSSYSYNHNKKYVTEWVRDKRIKTTYYKDLYIEVDYRDDDGNLQSLPISYKFYTVTNGQQGSTPTRKITNPCTKELAKHDIHYDNEGYSVKDDSYTKNWIYDINSMSWCK